MERTTARLRKTFQYPADNDTDESLPEGLDEEEQEHLISALHEENTQQNALYARILLAVPLLSILPYIPTLSTPRTALLSILSITSLASTAFLLHTLPPAKTSIPFLDSWSSPSKSSAEQTALHGHQHDGPIAKYLPLLNVGLGIMLALLGLVSRGNDLWWGFAWLPGVVYGAVLLAKLVMAGVDPERELGGLRYEFKGA